MTTREPSHGHTTKAHPSGHSGEPIHGHSLEPTPVSTTGPVVMDMATTAAWRYGAKWALAGPAAAVFAVSVLTIPKGVAMLIAAGILIAALGYAAGWNAKGRTDGR